MKQIYPIIMSKGDSHIVVFIPDFKINTQGADYKEAIEMARDAISLIGIDMINDGESLPEPSDIRLLPKDNNDDVVTLVEIDFDESTLKKIGEGPDLSFDDKINNYTNLLIVEAAKLGCSFIQDSGEGHDLETDTFYLEDVSGWLVPFGTPEDESRSDKFYRFAEWKKDEDGGFIISFKP